MKVSLDMFCQQGFVLLILGVLASARVYAEQPPSNADAPILRLAYFVPSDRDPFPNYEARLARVMTDIQKFYRDGMKRNGFGPMTFQMERDASGKLVFHVVQGNESLSEYPRAAKTLIREEVKVALGKSGVDMDHETVVIFQASEHEFGPFLGGGTGHKGSALVIDDPRIDSALLGSKRPGGEYKSKPCSIGEMNSHAIGGIAHELGHAFGLAHDSEREAQRARLGRSLMGSGSHDYGDERRREGPGAFFTPATAAPLSLHPLFTRKASEQVTLDYEITDLVGVGTQGAMRLSGNVSGGPVQAAGLVAFSDPSTKGGSYDAIGWPCPVTSDGTFKVALQDLLPGAYELRLRIYAETGQFRERKYKFTVNQFRRPDPQSLVPVD